MRAPFLEIVVRGMRNHFAGRQDGDTQLQPQKYRVRGHAIIIFVDICVLVVYRGKLKYTKMHERARVNVLLN